MDERAFGQLEAKVDLMEKDVRELKDDVKAIRSMLDSAQGSWKTLLAVSGVVSFISSLITWGVTTFLKK